MARPASCPCQPGPLIVPNLGCILSTACWPSPADGGWPVEAQWAGTRPIGLLAQYLTYISQNPNFSHRFPLLRLHTVHGATDRLLSDSSQGTAAATTSLPRSFPFLDRRAPLLSSRRALLSFPPAAATHLLPRPPRFPPPCTLVVAPFIDNRRRRPPPSTARPPGRHGRHRLVVPARHAQYAVGPCLGGASGTQGRLGTARRAVVPRRARASSCPCGVGLGRPYGHLYLGPSFPLTRAWA